MLVLEQIESSGNKELGQQESQKRSYKSIRQTKSVKSGRNTQIKVFGNFQV